MARRSTTTPSTTRRIARAISAGWTDATNANRLLVERQMFPGRSRRTR